MIRRSTFPKVLLLLAGYVFFSANTVYFLQDADGPLMASVDRAYHFDFETARKKGPHLNLKSAILVNYTNGEVIYARHPDQERPIASISKLVAAMVILDSGLPLDDSTATITREDAYHSSRSRLRVGYELTLGDLLTAGLMNSDNRAIRALARACSGNIEAFALEMNHKVRYLGLKHTHFVEPTGLSPDNVSTAHEVAKILHHAFEYDLIKEITARKRDRVQVVNRKGKTLPMANTNLMVHSRYHVLAGKTGYIRAADHCLTTLIENSEGEKLTIVVLGVPGDRLRFREARRLADWGFRQVHRAAPQPQA